MASETTLIIEGLDPWRTRQNVAQAAQMDFYVARIGDVPGRCADCAFRTGSDANRSQLVLHLVDNCLVHHGTFCCHHGEPDRPCVGYLALKQSFSEVSVPVPEAPSDGN